MIRKRDQVLAHVGVLPEWFDDEGDYVVWGNYVIITHPRYRPHKYDLENPDQGWQALDVKEVKSA